MKIDNPKKLPVPVELVYPWELPEGLEGEWGNKGSCCLLLGDVRIPIWIGSSMGLAMASMDMRYGDRYRINFGTMEVGTDIYQDMVLDEIRICDMVLKDSKLTFILCFCARCMGPPQDFHTSYIVECNLNSGLMEDTYGIHSFGEREDSRNEGI